MKEKNINTKIDVAHIYFGTQGTGGIYLDEIHQTLRNNGYNQEVIVSYYYPFSYGKKIFFKYTDLASGMAKTKSRMILRLFEYLYGLTYSFFFTVFKRPKIVNYSLISSFYFDILFIVLVKKLTNSKVVLTCHDVIPFSKDDKDKAEQIKSRRNIFSQADFLLVHTQRSKDELIEFFGINEKKIIMHLFPLMDIRKLSKKDLKSHKKYDFAFIGHLRREKGLDLLIDAWKYFSIENPDATILIAGNLPYNNERLNELKDKNANVILKYLSDEEYFEYISSSRTIVLPYLEGTNSGVLYNLVSLDINIIYSNLKMFSGNKLLNKNGMFITGDYKSLEERLEYFYKLNFIEPNGNVDDYKKEFEDQVIKSYNTIVNAN